VVGIVWKLLICALIGNAQPFGFLMGRHCIGIVGKAFHYFGEMLVEWVNGLDDFCNLGIEVFLDIG